MSRLRGFLPLTPAEEQVFSQEVGPILASTLLPPYLPRGTITVKHGISQAKDRFGLAFNGVFPGPGQIGIGPLTGKDFDLEHTFTGFWQKLTTTNGWNTLVRSKCTSKFTHLVVLGIEVLFSTYKGRSDGVPGRNERLNALVRAAGLTSEESRDGVQTAYPRMVKFTVGGVELPMIDLDSLIRSGRGFQEVEPFIIAPTTIVSFEAFIGEKAGFAEVKPWGLTVATRNYLISKTFIA